MGNQVIAGGAKFYRRSLAAAPGREKKATGVRAAVVRAVGVRASGWVRAAGEGGG